MRASAVSVGKRGKYGDNVKATWWQQRGLACGLGMQLAPRYLRPYVILKTNIGKQKRPYETSTAANNTKLWVRFHYFNKVIYRIPKRNCNIILINSLHQ